MADLKWTISELGLSLYRNGEFYCDIDYIIVADEDSNIPFPEAHRKELKRFCELLNEKDI